MCRRSTRFGSFRYRRPRSLRLVLPAGTGPSRASGPYTRVREGGEVKLQKDIPGTPSLLAGFDPQPAKWSFRFGAAYSTRWRLRATMLRAGPSLGQNADRYSDPTVVQLQRENPGAYPGGSGIADRRQILMASTLAISVCPGTASARSVCGFHRMCSFPSRRQHTTWPRRCRIKRSRFYLTTTHSPETSRRTSLSKTKRCIGSVGEGMKSNF